MKRAAETQLTKDNADSAGEDEEGSSGFKKADTESLAGRKIKGLPKRSSAVGLGGSNAQSTSTNSTSFGTSRFAAFSGFGATPANKDDAKTVMSPSLSSPATTGVPSTSSLFSASLPSRNDPTSVVTTSPPNPTQKYFTDIRGLNISYSKAIKELVEKDPFADLSSTAENYRTLREGIQKEYDSSGSKQAPQPPSITSTSTSTAPKAFSMPTPPPQFNSQLQGTTVPPTTTASAPSSPGFSWSIPPSSTEKPPAQSFSFSAPKSSSPGFFVFGATAEGPSTSGTATTKPAEDKQNTQSLDKEVGASSPSTIPNFFKPLSAPITPGMSSFLASPALTTASSPTLAFGSSSIANPTMTANKGNIGNPLGFSFGTAASKFPAFPSSTATTTAVPTVGDLPVKEKTPEEDGDEGGSENVGENAKEESSNPYDKDSSGEENEETLFESKSRAYRSVTSDGKKTWSPVGTGQLKLKKQKEGAKRRLLMRNSSNGKVIINTLVVPSFKLTVDGRTISFVVVNEDGAADLFKLRLSTEAEAKEWEAKVAEKL